MKRTSFDDMLCSTARSLDVIGEWWTPLILRDAFFGVRRFEDFQKRLGIARNVLADRLGALVDHGILERRLYEEHPRRSEYVLTRKGRELWPVLEGLRAWGDKWIFGQGNEPLHVVHDTCGNATHGVMTCAECGEPLRASQISIEGGPGPSSETVLPPSLKSNG